MTAQQQIDRIDQMTFGWPMHVKDPYGHIACDDVRFVEACAWSNRVWNEYQEERRAQLKKALNLPIH